jgi:hypothetical protein
MPECDDGKERFHYDRVQQFTLTWDDPRLGIWWPVTAPILSRRDQGCEEAPAVAGTHAAARASVARIAGPARSHDASSNT